MVTIELGGGDSEIPGGGVGERLSGYVEWYENTKQGSDYGEECGF